MPNNSANYRTECLGKNNDGINSIDELLVVTIKANPPGYVKA
jgi:hypothetical protein